MPQLSASKSQAPWRALVVAGLTLGLLWLFFRHVNFAALWEAITHARPGFIVLGVVVTFFSYLLRAWRWQAILRPLGHARLSTAFRTTVIGFTASFLLPARVGEVLRPYLLARKEGFKAPATFATIVIERVLDLLTVLLLFACSLPFLRISVGRDVIVAGVAAAVVGAAACVAMFLCAGHPERLGRWAERVTRHLPARAAAAAGHLVRTFAEGFVVMRRPSQFVLSALRSIPLWLSIALGIWLVSRAFSLTFSYPATFLVVMFLVVGVAVPTPGAVGGFHYFYLLAVTRFFGASAETAAAAALVLHAVSFVPVTITGLVFMSQDGLTLGGLKQMRQTAAAAEVP